MRSLLQDLCYALRVFARSPMFTAAAVISLALGIGANTAIFSIVHSVLLRSLPYRDPDRLVMVWEAPLKSPGSFSTVAVGTYLDWRDANPPFEEIGVIHETFELNLTGGDKPERLDTQLVTPSFFTALGVQPLLGRTFLPGELGPDAPPVVILNYKFWQRRFGGRTDVVGQSIELEDRVHTIIGVMPPGFCFLNQNAELWRPFQWSHRSRRGVVRYIHCVARLKAGETLAQAQSKMDAIAARIAADNPERNKGMGARLQPLHEALVGQLREPLLVLLGAVAFVLIIACANVANLLLSHAAARQAETAIRAAMGASRGRLIRQFLTESVVLGIGGSILGLLIAVFAVPALVALSPVEIPRRDEIGLNAVVLAVTTLIAMVTGLLFGLAPALLASRTDVNSWLKSSGSRASGAAASKQVRNVLATAQVAVALTLLIGAGLMMRTFLRLQSTNLGFDPDGVFTFQVRLSRKQYSKDTGMSPTGMNMTMLDPRIAQLFEQTVERLRRILGVSSASAITWLPMNGFWSEWRGFAIEGRPAVEGQRQPGGGYNPISTDFFRTLRIGLVRGRDFNQHDSADAPWVAIVNETAARTFWKNEDPIGQRITLDIDETPREIVGIVKDVKHYSIQETANPQVYVPHAQQPVKYWANRSRGRLHMSFIVRAAGKSPDWMTAFNQAVGEVDKATPVYAVKAMREYVTTNAGDTRLYMVLLSVFAGVALVLAAVGVYGVISYSVTQRTQEIGIRMALGARQRDAVRLVIGHGVKLASAGLALGIGLSFALTRVLKNQLYGVTATDPATFIAVSLGLAAIALAASYIPAYRASRIDPVVALRHE